MTRPAVDLKLKSLADKLLIELTLAGRQECFSALIYRHMDYVCRCINGLIPNPSDAEDVAQEVQLKVWMSLSSFRYESSFSHLDGPDRHQRVFAMAPKREAPASMGCGGT